jgi:mannose-6-phosphate isomerase-like protein (cupin superfamily)
VSFERTEGEISATYRPLAVPDFVGQSASTTFVALGSLTRRQFGIFRRDMKPHSGGPDAHVHLTFSESFYVLEGLVQLYDGRAWVEAKAGDFLYVPKGGIHAFKADSDEPASMLILYAPGKARENFVREGEEIRVSGRKLSEHEWAEFFARHDQYNIGGWT